MSKRKPPKPAPAPHPGNRSFPNKNQPLEPKLERGPYWLFGHHAMTAALANPRRRFRRLLRLADGSKVQRGLEPGPDRPLWEAVKREEIERLLPQGAVHQGVAALVEPFPETSVADLVKLA